MKKEVSEMVWPVENYTDKIHTGLKMMFITYPWLSFTIPQMRQHLIKGYNWLANPTEHQTALLDKLIKTGIQKLVQLGTVKKVTSKVSVEPQWQSTSAVADSGMINVTSDDSVAHTDEAKKAVKRRALGGQSLHVLNGQGKFGQLH